MYVIDARNVNEALGKGLLLLQAEGTYANSRNGSVLVAPTPVTTVYQHPAERVLFCPLRDANPFFHFMEGLWMLGGRNDVAWPKLFNSKFGSYSDDGTTLHGAYGFRWREFFNFDQLVRIIHELRENKETRRAVLGMWSPVHDLGRNGADIPCNTHIYFRVREGCYLDMTVCCRSNDALWGAYGANAVHMSMLLEMMAAATDLRIGVYYQVSNNLHLYTDVLPVDQIAGRVISTLDHDEYTLRNLPLYPMVTARWERWNEDLYEFLNAPEEPRLYNDPFFVHVATPMYRAWLAHKAHDNDSFSLASRIEAADWNIACCNWLLRRKV